MYFCGWKRFGNVETKFGNTGVGNTQFLDYFFFIYFYIKTSHVRTKNNENEVEKFL